LEDSLVRIDDRLIHGQVIVGWGSYLNTEIIIVGNDEIVQSEEEIDLYKNSVPSSIELVFLTIEETADYFLDRKYGKRKYILLLESPFDALRLLNMGVRFDKINIGGLHFKKGAKQYLNYVFLNEEEIKCLKKIIDMGIILECRELPQSKKVDLHKLFKKK